MQQLLLRFSAIILAILPLYSSAQVNHPLSSLGGCGTVVTQEHLDRMEDWKRSGHPVNRPIRKAGETILYPIQHHIVTEDDGSGGISDDDIQTAMDHNNAFFLTGDIQFYTCGPHNEIASSEWYDFVSSEEAALTAGNQVADVINMYWVGNISNNTVCGYAYFPGGPNTILMANGCFDGVTLEHELGHFFNLYHTHGKTSGGGFTDELVDGSNCSSAGDDVCDTPADPDLTGRVDFSSCTYAPGSPEPKDANGQAFNPDPSNIMAYTYDHCQTRFTQGQWDRVAAAQEHPSRTSYVCSTPPCVLRSFTTKDESSYGAYDGEIDMTILGSTGPYTIIWTGPNGFTANTEDITGLTAGRYYLDITDVTGCNQIDSLDIGFLGCAPDEVRALVTITTTEFAEDISWEIKNSFGVTVASGAGYEDNDVRVDTICLEYQETFNFFAYDAYGDGWGGTYEVRCGGITILANNKGNIPNNTINTLSPETEVQEEFVNDICSPIDLAVVQIVSPESTCNLTDQERVKVRVTNYGAMPITDYSLALGLNGVAPTEEAVTLTIGSYNSIEYTFNTFADLSNVQVHSILGDANALGDLNPGNDATVKLVEKEPIEVSTFPYQNDFENGLGILKQSIEDDLDWTANSGATPSNLTGPSGDHSTILTGGNGTYYYVEAGAFGNDNAGMKAVLVSPCIDMTNVSGPYLSFWYHMYGSTQGELRLEVNIGSQGWLPVWANLGEHGNAWEFVDIDMKDFTGMSIKFRFVGTVGNSYLSDIAIDDIEFRNETVPLNANIVSADNVSCKGLADGFATVNSYGGTPPHTYLWSTGGVTATEENLAPGVHSVTITDFNSETITIEVTVTEPEELFLSILETEDILCAGDLAGEICILGTGGTTPYKYSIDGISYQTSGCFDKLAAGVYPISVKDKNGCITPDTIEIIEPPVFEVELDSLEFVHCYGDTTGYASVLAVGGVPPYTYDWNTGDVGSLVSNLTAGINYVIVEDANGCRQSVTFEVVQSPRLRSLPINVVSTSCPGGNDGKAEVQVTGGTTPYVIEWINTGTKGSIDSNLSAGVYTVLITDSLGCTLVSEVTVTEPVALSTSKSSIMTTCFGCANGEAAVSADGGTPPYTYLWGNGVTDSLITGVAAGVYGVEITDKNGCTFLDSVEVVEPEQLAILLVLVNDVACYGESNGKIIVEAIGGIPPYSYEWSFSGWSNNRFGPTVSDLSKGVYTVTVTDSEGNETSLPVVVDEADPLIVTIDVVDDLTSTCQGGARANVSGGTPPYVYFWDDAIPSSSTNDSVAFTLCEGMYNLIIMDANFCSFGTTININSIGITEHAEEVMHVYPNPTSGVLKIRFDQASKGQLEVFNLMGELVYQQTGAYAQNQAVEVDLGSLPAGVYSIQMSDGNSRYTTKVLKQ